MRGMRLAALGALVAGWMGVLGGCVQGPTIPPVEDIEVPALVAPVVEDPPAYEAGDDDPLLDVEPGTAIDDLALLDGCWGSTFTQTSDESLAENVVLAVAIQFDVEASTYALFTAIAIEEGGLWPLLPVIAGDDGTYEVRDDKIIDLSGENYYSNVEDDADISTMVLEADVPSDVAPDRPALITLDGDEMLLYLGIESVDDVDETEERPVFFRIDCPAA